MALRMLMILGVALLPGCLAPRFEVKTHIEKDTGKPVARNGPKFGELISSPGQVVAKHPQPDIVTSEPASLWPVRKDEVVVEPIRTSWPPLLSQAPAADPPLVLALRDYLEGRTDKAIERIKDLSPANQELLLRLFPALVQASKTDLNRNATDAALLGSQLDAASDAAARLAPIKIRKACYVARVMQFGVYDPVPEKHVFLPGGSGVLYLELQNVPSVPAELPAGGKGFVTKLSCSHTLLDDAGKAAGPPRKFEHAEFTRSQVRDYFLKFEFDVPAAPGRYTLVIEVSDGPKRTTRHQVELRVGTSSQVP